MGQATMGQAPPRRMCHTQEIALEPRSDQWQTLGRWTTTAEVDQAEAGGIGRGCKAALVPPCCATDDGACSVEEVLVVHHDALRKVNFLLKVDELSGCELPAVPECVVAARRAELRKRQEHAMQEAAALVATGALSGLAPAGAGRDECEETLEVAPALKATMVAGSASSSSLAGPGRSGPGFSWIPPPADLQQDVVEPCTSREPPAALPPPQPTSADDDEDEAGSLPVHLSRLRPPGSGEIPAQPGRQDEALEPDDWDLEEPFQDVAGIDSVSEE